MAKELVYRVRVTTDKKAFSDFRRQAVGGQKDVEKSIRNTTQELDRQIELLDLYRQKGDITSEELSQGFEEIENRLKDIPVATRDVIRSQKKLLRSQQKATGSTQNFQKAQRNANQTLFSFGDIVNDAQQFQFGFAQGTRAIGNNIGFMAEQMSNTANRAGGFKNAIKAMGASLMGPGGLILGINLAVSAFTIFGDKLFDTEDKMDSFNDELKTTSDFFGELASESIEDFLEQTEGIDQKIEAIDDALNSLFLEEAGLQQLPTPVQQLNTAATDASNTFNNQMQPSINNTNQALVESALQSAEISQEAQKVLLNKRAELEAQKAINQALRDNLEITEDPVEVEFEFQRPGDQSFTDVFGTSSLDDTDEFQQNLQQQQALRLDTIQGVEQQISRLQNKFVNARTQKRRDVLQEQINMWKQELSEYKNKEDQKTQMQRAAEAQRSQMMVQAVGVAGDLIGQAFGQSKELATAQALISTYASAQKAYESQLAIPTPDAPIRAAKAAGLAVLQGLARVAQIQSTTLDSGASGGTAATAGNSISQGFQTNEIESQGRPDREVLRSSQNGESVPIHIELHTEADDKIISKKAERGRKKRETNAIKVSKGR